MNQQILALRQKALELETAEKNRQNQAFAKQQAKEAENWNDLVAQIKEKAPYLSNVPIVLDRKFEDACITFDNCVPIYILLSKSWQGEYWKLTLRSGQIHFAIRDAGQLDYFGDNIGAAVLAAERLYTKNVEQKISLNDSQAPD